MQTVNEMWDEFQKMVIDPEAPHEAAMKARMAFYCGVIALFDALRLHLPAEVAVPLQAELQAFVNADILSHRQSQPPS